MGSDRRGESRSWSDFSVYGTQMEGIVLRWVEMSEMASITGHFALRQHLCGTSNEERATPCLSWVIGGCKAAWPRKGDIPCLLFDGRLWRISGESLGIRDGATSLC